MKNICSFCLGKYLGLRFGNSFIELYSYDGSSEEDRLEVSRQIKAFVPQDKHGVTDFDLWVNRLSKPIIRIYVDTAENPLYRAFVTIPHEIEHALGTGVLRRAADFKMNEISPGCETLARINGVITYKFQNAYLKEVGYSVVKSDEESGL